MHGKVQGDNRAVIEEEAEEAGAPEAPRLAFNDSPVDAGNTWRAER